MKLAPFMEERIIGALTEPGAGARPADLARKHLVSEAALHDWKADYDGMDVSGPNG